MEDRYKVVNAHSYRKCHHETCACSTDFLVIDKENDSIAGKVDSPLEGSKLIKIMKVLGLEKITRSNLIDYAYSCVMESQKE